MPLMSQLLIATPDIIIIIICFEQFQKFEIIWVGALSCQLFLRKNFYMGSKFLFMATCALDLTFLAPLTSEI